MASTNDGFIQVFNNGVFLAYFSVIYDYKENIKFVESSIFPVLKSYTITIPEGATNIKLEVEIAKDFTNWPGIYAQYFDTPPKKCFKLTGVTFYAKCVEITCPVGGENVGGEINPPSNIKCYCSCCCNGK